MKKRKDVYVLLKFKDVPYFTPFRYKGFFTHKLKSGYASDPKVLHSFLVIPLDFTVAMNYNEYERAKLRNPSK